MATKKNGLQNIGIINQVLGQNLNYSIDGNKLTLEINLNAKATLSKSGKSAIIASSQGNQAIAFENKVLKLGLNLYEAV